MKVKKIMSKEVVAVSEDDTVKEVAKLFVQKKIGGAPVLRGDELVGMISEDDLIMQDVKIQFPSFIQFLDSFIYLGSMRHFEETLKKAVGARVRDVMTTDVVWVSEEDTIEDAATLMIEKRVNRVLVLRDGKLVGIVAKEDIIKAISRS